MKIQTTIPTIKKICFLFTAVVFSVISVGRVYAVSQPDLEAVRRDHAAYIPGCAPGAQAPATTPTTGSLQSLAQQMLQNPNVTYWTNNGVNTRDIVVALSEGKRAYTTSNDQAAVENREVDLNPNILQFILEAAQSGKVMVNALTDKEHSANSNHYKGQAVDLDKNGSNSPPTSVLDPIATKYGGTRNSETTHWHYDFTGGATAAPQTAAIPAECCPTNPSDQSSANETGSADLTSFVDRYGQAAFDIGKKYGIPYEAILGQAAIESANGNSQLTREAFNFFGIKAGSAWSGPIWTGETREEDSSGGSITIQDSFRSYPSAEAGFEGYGEFITTNSRYNNARNYPGNPEQYIRELKTAGYATDSSYVDTVMGAVNQVTTYIRANNLFPPSSSVVPDAVPPNPAGAASAGAQCGSAPTGGGSPEANRQIARTLMSQRGMPESEFACLDPIWTQESQWNHLAINDAEGNNDLNNNSLLDGSETISDTEDDAYGIPQSKPGGKMATSGSDWRTNPTTQIKWGLDYIQGRYGTPCGAKVHKDATGWY